MSIIIYCVFLTLPMAKRKIGQLCICAHSHHTRIIPRESKVHLAARKGKKWNFPSNKKQDKLRCWEFLDDKTPFVNWLMLSICLQLNYIQYVFLYKSNCMCSNSIPRGSKVRYTFILFILSIKCLIYHVEKLEIGHFEKSLFLVL